MVVECCKQTQCDPRLLRGAGAPWPSWPPPSPAGSRTASGNTCPCSPTFKVLFTRDSTQQALQAPTTCASVGRSGAPRGRRPRRRWRPLLQQGQLRPSTSRLRLCGALQPLQPLLFPWRAPRQRRRAKRRRQRRDRSRCLFACTSYRVPDSVLGIRPLLVRDGATHLIESEHSFLLQGVALGASPPSQPSLLAAAAAGHQPYGWPPFQQQLYPPQALQPQPIQPQLLHPSVAALRGSGMAGSAGGGSRRCFSAPTSPRAASTGGSGGRTSESPQTLIRVGSAGLAG